MQEGFALDCSTSIGNLSERFVNENGIIERFGVVLLDMLPHGVAMKWTSDARTCRQIATGIILCEPIEKLSAAEPVLHEWITVGYPLFFTGLLADSFIGAYAQPHFNLGVFGGAALGLDFEHFT